MKHLLLRECGYAIAALLVLTLIYSGAYLGLVTHLELPHTIDADGAEIEAGTEFIVDYRLGRTWCRDFFKPAHEVDRFIRPHVWQDEVDLQTFVLRLHEIEREWIREFAGSRKVHP
jgi:hypothetical protein